jgi:2-polyprenyl-6-hydroxyphenyl methylase/3-demethylubiquinone-9 3-methyltransferase
MLDIGCDTGELLAAAKRLAGVEAYGVDVAQRPLEAARAAGVTTHHGDVATAPPSFTDFALVTAVDVIEHVADPVAFLTEARSRLASDGAIYVETPNWHSTVYALGRLLTRAPGTSRSGALERLFPPEHVQYFTAQGLRIAAQRAGLLPLDVFTRVLPADALAGNVALKVAVSALQLPDRPFGRELLLCAILVPAEQT